MIYCPRNQSILKLRRLVLVHHVSLWFAAEYGMCLSRSSLTICHDYSIEAVEYILNNRPSNLLICLSLLAALVQNMIKEEISIFVILPQERNPLVAFLVNIQTVDVTVPSLLLCLFVRGLGLRAFDLFGEEWPHPNYHPKIRRFLVVSGGVWLH